MAERRVSVPQWTCGAQARPGRAHQAAPAGAGTHRPVGSRTARGTSGLLCLKVQGRFLCPALRKWYRQGALSVQFSTVIPGTCGAKAAGRAPRAQGPALPGLRLASCAHGPPGSNPATRPAPSPAPCPAQTSCAQSCALSGSLPHAHSCAQSCALSHDQSRAQSCTKTCTQSLSPRIRSTARPGLQLGEWANAWPGTWPSTDLAAGQQWSRAAPGPGKPRRHAARIHSRRNHPQRQAQTAHLLPQGLQTAQTLPHLHPPTTRRTQTRGAAICATKGTLPIRANLTSPTPTAPTAWTTRALLRPSGNDLSCICFMGKARAEPAQRTPRQRPRHIGISSAEPTSWPSPSRHP